MATIDTQDLQHFLEEAEKLGIPSSPKPEKMMLNPDNAAKGLLQLVLTLVEAIRELMERQAIRRIEAGSLTDEETVRVGLTLMRLEEQMQLLKTQFGFTDDDLQLDLGPLGNLR